MRKKQDERLPEPTARGGKGSATPAPQAAMLNKPDCGEVSYKGSGRLVGKVALITGGDSGIGRAVAIAFAREGADVGIMYDANTEDAEDTAKIVRDAGRRCLLIKADVSVRANCVAAVRQVVRELGTITTLVNNAGIGLPESSIEQAAEHIERVMAVNLNANIYLAAVRGMHFEKRRTCAGLLISCRCGRYLRGGGSVLCNSLSQEAVKHFKDWQGCTIIQTTSVNAYVGNTNFSYTASKAAQVGLTRCLAKDLVSRGIRVNCVAPGPVATPLVLGEFAIASRTHIMMARNRNSLRCCRSRAYAYDACAVQQTATGHVRFGELFDPMKRAAQPCELAPSYVFLASSDSSYITGQCLHVDGGMSTAS
jgi:NAD(P)-dependent dehydrogenase (short-subunit alcohol dehydrogenase family)